VKLTPQTSVPAILKRYEASPQPLRSMAADLAKKNLERNAMTERLDDLGIEVDLPDGAICLLGRFELLIGRYEQLMSSLVGDGGRGR
jgi:hypothetical protein